MNIIGYLYTRDPLSLTHANTIDSTIAQAVYGIEKVDANRWALLDSGGNYINQQAAAYGAFGSRPHANGRALWETWRPQGNCLVAWNGMVYYFAVNANE